MNLLDHVLGIRLLIHRAFNGKMERLGIEAAKYSDHNGLSSEDEALRQRLININNSHIEESKSFEEAREYTLKQCVFTLFNRLAAIKLMERKELFPEVIKQRAENGGLSAGHQAWLEEHPEGRSLERDGLAQFIYDKFEELASDIPLYRADYPYSIMPTADELSEIIRAFNDIENDEECAAAWQGDDILGWLYENFNTAEKVKFKESGEKTEYDKVSLQSQVYTPSWVVKFLVDNSLGKQYLEMFPESRLDQIEENGKRKYLIANRPKERVRKPKDMREIKVIDPACGSGNFLLYTFTLLYDMYIDQAENFGKDYSRREIPAMIVEDNIFGIDLDERAVQLAQIALLIKAREIGGRRATMPKHTNIVCSNFYLPPYEEVKQAFGYETSEYRLYETKARKIWTDLADAHKFGSLIRVDEQLKELMAPVKGEQLSLFGVEEQTNLFNEGYKLRTQLHNLVNSYGEKHSNPYTLLKMNEAMTFLDIISKHYDTVVANPPYTDSSDFGAELKGFVDANYRSPLKFNTNLYSCFIKRCCELAGGDGKVGMVNPPTFMYIKTFEDTRKFILDKTHINLFVEWGYLGMFSSFARVDSAMFVLEMVKTKDDSTFIKLNDLYEMKRKDVLFKAFTDYLNDIPNERVYSLPQKKLKGIKSYPFIYWISDEFREKFGSEDLDDTIFIRQGGATGDNERTLRYFWEVDKNNISEDVEIKKDYVFYPKGGPFRKWYGNNWVVIAFNNPSMYNYLKTHGNRLPSESFYLQEGVTYCSSGSRGCSFRYMPSNQVISGAGPGIYPSEKFDDIYYYLGFLNSILSTYLLNCLNPTVNITQGDIKRVPFAKPTNSLKVVVHNASEQNSRIRESLCHYSIIEPHYEKSPITTGTEVSNSLSLYFNTENALLSQILLNEAIINHIIFEVYDLSEHDCKMVIEQQQEKGIIIVGDLPVSHEAKKAYRHWLTTESEFKPSNDVLEHLDNLEERDSLPSVSDFNVLYQTNKEWEEFCIQHKMNPIEVWWQFKNAGVLPPQRTQVLAFELITDVIRTILAKDDDGVIPLTSNSGEASLAPRIEAEMVERGYSAAQIAQVFSLLGNGNLQHYLQERFFQQLSDHLNLFMYLPKTPFIWHITSGQHHALELFVSIYTWKRDTLLRIKSVYAANREASLNDRLQVLLGGDAAAKAEAAEVRLQLKELNEFRDKIDLLLASGYNPKLDDGVAKNIAPLQKAKLISYDVLSAGQMKKYLNADW